MNYENINNVINNIQNLQERGFNILRDPEMILSDFELLNEAKYSGRHILSAQYPFIKNIQVGLYKSLASVDESQINEFIPLFHAIEKVRLALSQEYEERKLISTRVRKLKNVS